MNTNLLLGIVFLVGAVVLLYFGYITSQSVGEQAYGTIIGRFTNLTTWYFAFGIAAVIGGARMLAAWFEPDPDVF